MCMREMVDAIISPGAPLILVVEDDFLIRMAALDALIDAGFTVVEAEHAAHALTFLHSAAATVAAMFTDVRMPGELNGVELAHETRRCWPWIHLLITSANVTHNPAELPENSRFLQKPYEMPHVIGHLREMIAA